MKVAIITGGSRGLGKALVDQYVVNGYLVVSISRTDMSDISNQNIKAISFDLSAIEDYFGLEEQIFSKFEVGEVSELVLINNAGDLGEITKAENYCFGAIDQTIKLNLTAPIALSSMILRNFKASKSQVQIYTISSGAAFNPYYGWTNYCATKSGIEMMTKTIAIEQDDNVKFRINTIVPGVIDTAMQTKIRQSSPEDFANIDKFLKLKSENLLLSPKDVAKKIYNLQSINFQSGETIVLRDL